MPMMVEVVATIMGGSDNNASGINGDEDSGIGGNGINGNGW